MFITFVIFKVILTNLTRLILTSCLYTQHEIIQAKFVTFKCYIQILRGMKNYRLRP